MKEIIYNNRGSESKVSLGIEPTSLVVKHDSILTSVSAISELLR